MAKTPCDEHSGHCVRLDELERQNALMTEALDNLKRTMNRWGGIFVGIAALPLMMKLFELFAPAAHAIGVP